MSRNANKPRLFFNDVVVESIEVTGGVLDYPDLVPLSNGNDFDPACSSLNSSEDSRLYPEQYDNYCNQSQGESGRNTSEPQFVMIVSDYQIAYSVLDCGYGLPIPTGYYESDDHEPMSLELDIEQVVMSEPMCSSLFINLDCSFKKHQDQCLVISLSPLVTQLLNFLMTSRVINLRCSCLYSCLMKEVG